MNISIYNSIKVNSLDSKPVNTIQDAKMERTNTDASSHLGMHIHKVSKDTRGHLLAIYSPRTLDT